MMHIAKKNGLELLDLKFKIMEEERSVDVYSEPTNSFKYVVPSTCYPYKNIKSIPKSIALGLQQIFDADEKNNQRSSEYQKYLVGREYNPTLVKKQFEEVGKMTRTQARASKQKPNQVRKTNFFY